MLHLTPQMLVQGYELLRVTPPFEEWGLPESDAVAFYATSIDRPGRHGNQGEHWFDGTMHHVRVNPNRHHSLRAMLETLAHEMCHMRQEILGTRGDINHGRQFQGLARIVCRCHIFDLGQF